MAYKLKKLVDEGFDFNSLYPQGVEEAKQATMLNYSLQEIVDFLRNQTNDFKDDFVIAKDLDNAIYRIYEKHIADTKPEMEEEEPTPSPDAAKKEKSFTKQDIKDSIDGLQLLADMGDQDAIDAIAGLELLLLF